MWKARQLEGNNPNACSASAEIGIHADKKVQALVHFIDWA